VRGGKLFSRIFKLVDCPVNSRKYIVNLGIQKKKTRKKILIEIQHFIINLEVNNAFMAWPKCSLNRLAKN